MASEDGEILSGEIVAIRIALGDGVACLFQTSHRRYHD